MQLFPTARLRNVVVLAHSGAGKTSLAEAMLFRSGAISRMGKVEDGNTVSDYEPEEIRRKSSIQTSIIPCIWKDCKINLLDTPGFADFAGEMVSGIRVADGALVVIAAPSGVEVGTEQVWKWLDQRGLPRLVFINKMDRENADFGRALESLQQTFGRKCVPLQLPLGAQSEFRGVVDLTDPSQDWPSELQNQAREARDRLVEAVAETDDELATKYLEGEAIQQDELVQGLRRGVGSGEIVPVLVGSATLSIGIAELMDAILNYLPSPAEAIREEGLNPSTGEKVPLVAESQAPLAALVFKTTADPYVGKLSYFRVYQGTLHSDSQVWNANKGEAERIGQLFVPRGKSQEPVAQLFAGDIGSVSKLAITTTGDTLTDKDYPWTLSPPKPPPSNYTVAVYPKSKADVDKMVTSLYRMVEEDPTLKVHREPDTGETLLAGLGDVHVEMAVERCKRKFGVDLGLRLPKIPYKETITTPTQVEHRYKQQTGGHGHYAHVFLRLEPLPRGSGVQFADEVVGGRVPREFIPYVEKGVRRACEEGVLAGYPIMDLKVVLYDGSYHVVDSAGIDFDTAGYLGLKKGVQQAKPVLLEPILYLKVRIPEAYTGDVMGDLNGKRGRILGMTPNGDGTTTIEAHVPMAEMQRYAVELRAMTQSRGDFTLEFDHYEEVPPHLAQRVIEQRKAAQE